MREIKFRAWGKFKKKMFYWGDPDNWGIIMHNLGLRAYEKPPKGCEADELIPMQFTGLYDKNGKGLTELYEGDILNEKGEICANIHQKYHKRTTDFIIEKMGTKKWRDTEQEAIRRGWGYAE